MHVPSSPQSRSLWQALLVALLEFTTTTATAHTKNHSDCAIVHRPACRLFQLGDSNKEMQSC